MGKGTEITRNANNIHVRKIILKKIKNVLHPFGNHVHPHGITRATSESQISILPSHSTLNTLEPGKSTRPEETPLNQATKQSAYINK